MGSHGSAFGGGVTDDVDPVGDLGLWAEGAFKGGGVERWWEPVDLSSQSHSPADGVTGHGGVQHPRSPGKLGRTRCDQVSLDVIAVSIAAVRVVRQEDIDGLLEQDVGEELGGFFDIRAGEPGLPRRIRQGLWSQTAVCKAEVFHAGHPQRSCALTQLAQSSHPQPAVGNKAAGSQTLIAVGRHDQDDPVALRRGASHRPGGEQGLVVGVGVESQEGVRHQVLSCLMRGWVP